MQDKCRCSASESPCWCLGQAWLTSQVCPATPIKRSTTACENPDQEFIQFYIGTKTKLPRLLSLPSRASCGPGLGPGPGGRRTPRQEASGPVDLCVVNHGPPSPSPSPSPSPPLPLPPSIFVRYPRFDALHIHTYTQRETYLRLLFCNTIPAWSALSLTRPATPRTRSVTLLPNAYLSPFLAAPARLKHSYYAPSLRPLITALVSRILLILPIQEWPPTPGL